MKKSCIIIALLALTVSLTACGDMKVEGAQPSMVVPMELEAEPDNGDTNNESIEVGQEASGVQTQLYNTAIAQESEFHTMMLHNPIDRDYATDREAESDIRIRNAVAYRDAWNAEIDHALEILKEYLTEEDYKTLEQAHAGWEQYMDSTMSVEQNIFYAGMFYGIGSNDTYPMVMEAVAERTKEYAIELMALEYAFTGTVEFAAGN